MKKMVLMLGLMMIAGNAFAQTALPDLKVVLGPMTFKYTKYPWSVAPQSSQYRLSPGDIATIAVKVSNNGRVASGPFTVEIALNIREKPSLEDFKKDKVFTRKFADLKPGVNETYFQDFEIEAPDGDVRCELRVISMAKDDGNNSDNVQHCGTILFWQKGFVSEYLRPDLVVELTSPNSTRRLTLPIRILAVVTNRGNATSRSTDLILECKERDTKKLVVPPLKPGESFKHEFQHKWYTLGQKRCVAKVNSSKRTSELNDLNNSSELIVDIK
ncbi:MAG: hypothetical protein MUQ25_06155 [Candidatus Aminicenantes bacterium]|nr:hypothetical protein [Candidatus Aminicenantes bacterium]